jgi:hypothetical protein
MTDAAKSKSDKFKRTMAKKRAAALVPISDITLVATNANISYEEYYDFNDNLLKLFTSTTADRWAKELVAFAKRPDVLKATDWFIDNGIEYSQAMHLCDKYPQLAAAYKHSKYMIGNRRERGGLRNELNAGMIHTTMAMYDPEHKAHAEWKARLAQDTAANKGNVNITIQRYAPTSVVPDRLPHKDNDDSNV